MGRLNHDQGEFFYCFVLMRPLRTMTQLERSLRFSPSWVHAKLARFIRRLGGLYSSAADDPDAHRRLHLRSARSERCVARCE